MSEKEYDERGNLIHEKDGNKKEAWFDYEKGKLIHKKLVFYETDEIDVWYDYDKKGNLIHQKYSGGPEVWFDYNDQGKCIHRKESNGNGWWFDDLGSLIKKIKAK